MSLINNRAGLSWALITLLCAMSSIGFAQGLEIPNRITAGETRSGVLEPGDFRLPNTGYPQQLHDFYLYDGRAGERITLKAESKEFDALVKLGLRGRERVDDCYACKEDKEGVITLPESATYVVVVMALLDTQKGAYTVSVASQKPAASATAPALTEIADGETRVGTLPASPKEGDLTFDEWAYRGKAGERVRITVRPKKGNSTDHPDVLVGEGRAKVFTRLGVAVFRPFPSAGYDIVLTRDALVTIRVADSVFRKGGPYSVSVEVLERSIMVDGSAPAEGIWRETAKSDDGTTFFVSLGIETIIKDFPRIYRFRIRWENSPPVSFGKAGTANTTVAVVETECHGGSIQFISIAGYNGNALVASTWIDTEPTRFATAQVGAALSKFICEIESLK